MKLWPDLPVDSFALEQGLYRKGLRLVAGIDEVGRGPLAGPVVAACVVLPIGCDYRQFVDSKKISHNVRLRLLEQLVQMKALTGIGVVGEAEIDRINILQASLLAMKKAVLSLAQQPDFLLVDGKFPIPHIIPQLALIKGETKSASIAAASIVAKVHRDRLMDVYDQQYPCYNFAKNKGYPTQEHRKAIEEYGPCAIHRRSFKGVIGS